MSKELSQKQLFSKEYKLIEGLSPEFRECFGDLEEYFTMLIWGQSAQGKSNFVMQLCRELSKLGTILYLSLEESHALSLKNKVVQHLGALQAETKIKFTDHTITFDELKERLKKKRSPRIVITDSVQYLGLSFIQYKELKKLFPRKIWIFISHAKGKIPDGKTADKIRYDAGLKIRVEGKIAFIESRYGGTKNFVIWEDGAKKYWGKDFKKMVNRR